MMVIFHSRNSHSCQTLGPSVQTSVEAHDQLFLGPFKLHIIWLTIREAAPKTDILGRICGSKSRLLSKRSAKSIILWNMAWPTLQNLCFFTKIIHEFYLTNSVYSLYTHTNDFDTNFEGLLGKLQTWVFLGQHAP